MHPTCCLSLHTMRLMPAFSSTDVTVPVNHTTLKYHVTKQYTVNSKKQEQIK